MGYRYLRYMWFYNHINGNAVFQHFRSVPLMKFNSILHLLSKFSGPKCSRFKYFSYLCTQIAGTNKKRRLSNANFFPSKTSKVNLQHSSDMDFIFVKSTRKGYEDFGNIYARVRKSNKVYKVRLGITVKEVEWLKYKTMRYNSSAIITSLGIRYGQLANIFMQIKHALEESFDPTTAEAICHGIIYSTLNDVTIEMQEKSQQKGVLLRDHMKEVIEEFTDGSRSKRRRAVPVSKGYIGNLRVCLNSLKLFESKTRKRYVLEDIDMKFQNRFIKYLRDGGRKQNTIKGYLSSIRSAMQIAYNEKKTTCVDFMNSEFVPSGELVDMVYLKPDQIEQMRTLDISSLEIVQDLIRKAKIKDFKTKKTPQARGKFVKTLNYTRDIFIVGCHTGQRYSDYSRINKDMIVMVNDKPFIKLRQVKTGKTVLIPYDARVKEILDKYDGCLPKINKSTFDKQLHLICELLGWTQLITFDDSDGKEKRRLCDMVTSHTARRSFASNAYAAGVPLASILAVTGHSSEKNLRTYLRLDSTEKAIIAAVDFKDFLTM